MTKTKKYLFICEACLLGVSAPGIFIGNLENFTPFLRYFIIGSSVFIFLYMPMFLAKVLSLISNKTNADYKNLFFYIYSVLFSVIIANVFSENANSIIIISLLILSAIIIVTQLVRDRELD